MVGPTTRARLPYMNESQFSIVAFRRTQKFKPFSLKGNLRRQNEMFTSNKEDASSPISTLPEISDHRQCDKF